MISARFHGWILPAETPTNFRYIRWSAACGGVAETACVSGKRPGGGLPCLRGCSGRSACLSGDLAMGLACACVPLFLRVLSGRLRRCGRRHCAALWLPGTARSGVLEQVLAAHLRCSQVVDLAGREPAADVVVVARPTGHH